MHEIYKKSYCNLAVSDNNSGPSFPVHTCYAKGRKGTVLEANFRIVDSNGFEKAVKNSKLISRAWVHQEVVLAPRTLYFTQRQVFWSCTTTTEAETSDQPSYAQSRSSKDLSVAKVFIEQNHSGDALYFSCSQIWSKNILYCAACDLTFGSDKLPAISALARYMGTIVGKEDRYLAGLWERYLHLHLLWSVRDRENAARLHNPSSTRSWASIKSRIYNFRLRDGYQEHISLMSLEAVRMSHPHGSPEDIYGRVEGGELDLRGILVKLEMEVILHTKLNSRWLRWKQQRVHQTCSFLDLDFAGWATGHYTVYCFVTC